MSDFDLHVLLRVVLNTVNISSCFLLFTDFRMVKARKCFIKMQQKAKMKKQEKEKSWRPIIDRRKKSSSQSRPSSRSSRKSSSFNSSGETTPNDSCSSDVSFPAEKSGLSQNLSDLLLNQEDNEKSLDGRENTEMKTSSSKLESVKEMKLDTRLPFSEHNGNQNSDAPPVKKMRTAGGCKTTLQDLNLGDGIITRRRLPKVLLSFLFGFRLQISAFGNYLKLFLTGSKFVCFVFLKQYYACTQAPAHTHMCHPTQTHISF